MGSSRLASPRPPTRLPIRSPARQPFRRSLSYSPWLRRVPLALGLAVALGWLPWSLYGRTGLAHLMKLRAEVTKLREENAALRAKNRALRTELGLYEEDDKAAVERIARDELGMVKKGEIVFKIEEGTK